MKTQKRNKQLKQIETQSQSGRSMVEILGVLVIIAVLTIGGLVGFRYAMNYYQANQIAHEINMMRTDAKVKIAQGAETLTLGSPYDDKKTLNFNDYPTDFGFIDSIADSENPEEEEEGEEGYYITVSDIPQGICKPLASLLNGMDGKTALLVNNDNYDVAANLCNQDKNSLTAKFSAENMAGSQSAGQCEDESDCNGGYCQNHICIQCKESNDCGEFEVCDQQEGTCTTDCTKGACNNGICVDGICKGCRDTTDCNGLACIDNQCVPCNGEPDCGGKHCLTGSCVECRTGADCSGGKGCLSDNTCGNCTDDSQCASNNCQSGECKNCATSADCRDNGACENGICYDSCAEHPSGCGNGTHCDSNTLKCERNCQSSEACADSEVCNKETGICEEDCTAQGAMDCKDGYYCDTVDTHKCEPKCQSSAECADSEVCNEETGICEEDCTAQGAMDCKDGYYCNETSKKCESKCQSSAECADSKVCNEETGICEDDCTAQGAMPCKDGYHCDTNNTHKCVKNCTETDCLGATPICDATTHECRACTKESDCTALGKHCDTSTGKATSGTCVACTGSTHCGDDKPYCDINNGNICKSCYEAFGNTAPKWSGTACVPCESGTWNVNKNMCMRGECADNSNCQVGYYCDTTATSSCSNGKNTREDEGVCKPIGTPKQQTVSTSIGAVTYYNSPVGMDWWSAVRYCDALKTKGLARFGILVSFSELGCDYGLEGVVCSGSDLWYVLNFVDFAWTSTPENDNVNSCNVYAVWIFRGTGGIDDRTRMAEDSSTIKFGTALCR